MYHERRDQHFLAFHEKKTWALICGCGFGDIAANRFRIHLDLVHGQKRDVEEIADEYYFHNLPEYTTLKPCFNEKYKGHCKFRTPYLTILQQSNRCEEGLKYSTPPPATKFFDFLPPTQRPTWGYPHEDRLNKKKKASGVSKPANQVKSVVAPVTTSKPVASKVARKSPQVARKASPTIERMLADVPTMFDHGGARPKTTPVAEEKDKWWSPPPLVTGPPPGLPQRARAMLSNVVWSH